MKQYILLDWDGNLAKTLHIWLEAVRVPMQQRGIWLTDEEIAESFGAPVEYFTTWGVKDMDAAIEEMDSIAKQKMSDVELYPDTLEVLEELHNRKKRIALITSTFRYNVMHLLEKYNLTHYFDAVVAGDDVKHRKPHPEPLEKALAALGGTKEEAIMIGDSDKDMGVALNAGVDSILFYPEEHKKFYSLEALQKLKPTHVVDDFRDILKIV